MIKIIRTIIPVLILFLLGTITMVGQNLNYEHKENVLDSLLTNNNDLFGKVLQNPEKYKTQIIYTQIDRDSVNFPHFKTYTYHLNPGEYFYPASTVKLPASVLSLEKLNDLNISGLSKYTNLRIDSAYPGQMKVEYDSSSSTNLPSIAQYIRKIFLVSDNDAFNNLYEFLGQRYFNQQIWKKRYCDVKILRRLSFDYNKQDNRHTNPFEFYKNNKIIYKQAAQYNPVQYRIYAHNLIQGKV